MPIWVVFYQGGYIGCYDSKEAVESALGEGDEEIQWDGYRLISGNRVFEVLADTLVTVASRKLKNPPTAR
jgi:hypothetical protein